MFHTNPNAENKVLSFMNSEGEKTWRWVELALRIPIFVVTCEVRAEDFSIYRDFIFGEIKDVLSLMNASNETLSISEVGLLSPGHINGSNSFQLGKIKEIWQQPGTSLQLFVLADGTKLRSRFDDKATKNDQDWELVLSI